jgi:hypothetical protein
MSKLMAVALALGIVGFSACSNDEGDASVVSEARANPPAAAKDYGWRASPDFSNEKKDEVREYH